MRMGTLLGWPIETGVSGNGGLSHAVVEEVSARSGGRSRTVEPVINTSKTKADRTALERERT